MTPVAGDDGPGRGVTGLGAPPAAAVAHEELRSARRLVVKVGSSSLTTATGGLDALRLDALVAVLARRRNAGGEVVLVSSGAIAAGLAPLGLRKRPRDLASQQAAASVGQGLLLAEYARAFAHAGLTVGQVLLTAEDVVRRSHYGNAQRTLERLLSLGVVPVVNENDTVATHEIRFGDNDRLAALVAHLVRADALVLLSDVDALYDAPPSQPGARRLALVGGPADLADVSVGAAGAAGVGTGGMATKVEAAAIAVAAGVPALVTSAALAGPALAGEDVGTWFTVPPGLGASRRSTRQLWLAHAATPVGRLVLDDGAVRAVRERRSSLLPAGVTAVHGRFGAGDPVDLVDRFGHALARGLVNYSSEELPDMLGRTTAELAQQWGPAYEREVVHRDHLVLLGRPFSRTGTSSTGVRP